MPSNKINSLDYQPLTSSIKKDDEKRGEQATLKPSAKQNQTKSNQSIKNLSGAFILGAPGNYGLRLLSIFVPGLDPNGSSNQRQELLKPSIYVTLRNPWGIGMGILR